MWVSGVVPTNSIIIFYRVALRYSKIKSKEKPKGSDHTKEEVTYLIAQKYSSWYSLFNQSTKTSILLQCQQRYNETVHET